MKYKGVLDGNKTNNSFNRTIVELKWGRRNNPVNGLQRFNRTIVELKFEGVSWTHTSWDRFNRTIVELKFKYWNKKEADTVVLIALL